MRVSNALGLAMALVLAGPELAAAATLYVSNEKDNTISVVDAASMTVTGTIPVGRRPRGISLSQDQTKLYVCAGDSDRVEVVDLASGKITDSLPSGPDPELFVLAPDGRILYIANENDNLVTAVDVTTKAVVAEIEVGVEPEGMAVSPDGSLLVATSETTSMAHFIDTKSHEIVDNVLVGSRPRVAQFSIDGKRVWVSSEVGGEVTVIDAATRAVLQVIRFAIPGVPKEAIQPVGIALEADGKRAFVALGPANRVAQINQQSFAVERYYLVGQRVWNLAFSPDGGLLYTTNGVSSDISVIDLATERVTQSVGVGRLPWGIVVKR
ncbi:MAG: PQQ-dependent catabolism-associated beta-propeller protein [Azospirillum sp.]|nr:PQQ-dependent catabolism-associated beta-propeller protein [Azospirillum sp.]